MTTASRQRLARAKKKVAPVATRAEFVDPFGETHVLSYAPDAGETARQTRLLPSDSAERKRFPIGTGFMDYFPDAIAAVAEVSYLGNQKHNPGEPTHWARGKSMDHADCITRHFIERGTRDNSGIRHSAQLAWRALALLQEELEKELGLELPRGAWTPVQQA